MGGEITGELSASKFLGDLTGTADAAKEANKLATEYLANLIKLQT